MRDVGNVVALRAAAAGLAVLSLLAAAPAGAADRGEIRDGVFFPGRAPAEAFGEQPDARCRGSFFSRLPREVAKEAKATNAPEAVASPALCAMAESLMGWSEPANPREGVIAFLSSYLGLPTPARQAFVTEIETADDDLIAERLAETIVRHAKSVPNARYGAAIIPIPKEDRFSKPKNRLVLVLGEEPFSLEPLPRRLAAGGKARLAGTLQGDLQNPKVVVSDARGVVSEPAQAPGKAFQAELACGTSPGTIRVEVSAEQGGTRRVVGNFPVACAVELPTSVPVFPTRWPSDVAAQERKVIENLNAERTRAGLPALAWDDAVAGVARTLAENFSDPAKRATAGQAVIENLEKAGASSSLLLVNPATGRSVEEASERLLASPAHRANALNTEVNHAGAGIVTVTDGTGGKQVFLAEIFVRYQPPVDPKVLRRELAGAIAARREEARLPALPEDPALQEAAQRYAQEMAAAKGGLPEERDTQLLDGLRKTYKAVSMLAGTAASPAQFAQDRKVLASGKAIGIGLAQGDHPKLGRNASYVVVLIGEPQDKPRAPATKKK